MKTLALVLILCFGSLAFADDFKTVSGKEYKNVTVSRVEPDGIVIKFQAESSRFLSPSYRPKFKRSMATIRRRQARTPLSRTSNKPRLHSRERPMSNKDSKKGRNIGASNIQRRNNPWRNRNPPQVRRTAACSISGQPVHLPRRAALWMRVQQARSC